MLSSDKRFVLLVLLLAGGAASAAGAPQSGSQPAASQQDGAPPPAAGPQGSSRPQPGEMRFDEVGHAGVRAIPGTPGPDAVVAAQRSLPPGSFVEVTALDTGRTILVLVTGNDSAGSTLIDLSPAAARQLGLAGTTGPVRVRKVNPVGPEQAALHQGRAASERLPAPPTLLAGLRHRLGPAPLPIASAPPAPPVPVASAKPSSPPVPSPKPAASRPAAGADVALPAPAAPGSGYYVQVAALSNAGRAQSLAQSLGGIVRRQGTLYRVQLGPYHDADSAHRARAQVAGRGYGDARIVLQ